MSTKTKNVKKPSVHPVYKDMVISVLKKTGKKGKSRIAIIKEIKENFSINSLQHDKLTKLCLKRLLEDGKIDIVKGVGVSGSLKLSTSVLESEGKKKRKAASAKKPVAKKPTTATSPAAPPSTPKKPATPAKKPPTAKRASPKKAASAKPKAKDTPKKKPTTNKAANKPAAKAKKSPVKKPKTPKKATPKKK